MDINPIPIQIIEHPITAAKGVQLEILRLDKVHPVVSGNKWYKLKHNISEAIHLHKQSILTFGGAYSNHLHATAAYCHAIKMPCIGIVRGNELNPLSNPTLADCHQWGMELHFVSRSDYSLKEKAAYVQDLAGQRHAYIIPEGGHNANGAAGIAAIFDHVSPLYDYIGVSVGSGTTIAGICNYLHNHQVITSVIGYVPMKNGNYIAAHIDELLIHPYQYQLVDNYHFGGFGKTTPALNKLMQEMNNAYKLPLDPVYTSKMIAGIFDMVSNEKIAPGSKILAIHTGGLQGNSR